MFTIKSIPPQQSNDETGYDILDKKTNISTRRLYRKGSIQYYSYDDDMKLHGTYNFWRKGILVDRMTYDYGHKEKAKHWYESGRIKSIGYYKNNSLDKRYREWNEDGRLVIDWFYVDGYRHGVQKTWDGKKMAISYFHFGNMYDRIGKFSGTIEVLIYVP